MILRQKWGLGVVITACWAKPCWAKCLVLKEGYMRVEGHRIFPTAVNNTHCCTLNICALSLYLMLLALQLFSEKPPFPLSVFIRVSFKFPALGKDVTIQFVVRPPLWSSGQSFWLQIQRSRVRFPALPDFF